MIILLIAFYIPSFGQSINGVPFDSIDVEYVEIVGKSHLFSSKVKIELDFGQENSFRKNKDNLLLDTNGKRIIFSSMIDALNFMSKNGYDYVDAYTLTIGDTNVYHYLLRKSRKEKLD